MSAAFIFNCDERLNAGEFADPLFTLELGALDQHLMIFVSWTSLRTRTSCGINAAHVIQDVWCINEDLSRVQLAISRQLPYQSERARSHLWQDTDLSSEWSQAKTAS